VDVLPIYKELGMMILAYLFFTAQTFWNVVELVQLNFKYFRVIFRLLNRLSGLGQLYIVSEQTARLNF
jgi:hypothetical protein